ncbi:TetR/AcrR family transcriptional regulator [Streptomyces sp. NPDC050658]|uniref:TetR/AcrR family transcriptional regulator n=1 Tax=unclassified Streptomyces TaxID=2593676 RepID=UPI00341C6FCA
MPKLWSETIETHRRAVQEAILEATAELVTQNGPLAVTMSQIAERADIGRATLYKYFPDVQSILVAWHDREVSAHLEVLAHAQEQGGDPGKRLEAVLEAYALIQYERARRHGGGSLDTKLALLLRQGDHVAHAERRIHEMVRDVLAGAAASGRVRDDVAPAELAAYCLSALQAARSLPSAAAARRLVAVTLAGLQPGGSV